MKLISIPYRYNYIECYLTLRCPLNCPYCINAQSPLTRKRNELTAEQWLDGLNRMDVAAFGPRETPLPITIGGGEPTTHPGFYEIINGLRKDLRVDLLTNCTFDVREFADKIPPYRLSCSSDLAYKAIRVSYHPATMDPDQLVHKVKFLQGAGFSIGIFGVSHPENMKANVEMAEIARKAGVYFFIKDFLGRYRDRLFGFYAYPAALDGADKPCECRTKELLMGPDGSVYRCHRDLYAGESAVGSITDPAFDVSDQWLTCTHYGTCNPCDVKSKLNRYMDMGNCSVEIQPIV